MPIFCWQQYGYGNRLWNETKSKIALSNPTPYLQKPGRLIPGFYKVSADRTAGKHTYLRRNPIVARSTLKSVLFRNQFVCASVIPTPTPLNCAWSVRRALCSLRLYPHFQPPTSSHSSRQSSADPPASFGFCLETLYSLHNLVMPRPADPNGTHLFIPKGGSTHFNHKATICKDSEYCITNKYRY